MRILILFFLLSLSTASADAKHEKFRILKGKGVEVCEAYKRALEEIDFVRPPYCERPVNPSPEWLERECRLHSSVERCKNNIALHAPKGFPPEKRIYLTSGQIFSLYDRVSSFLYSSNQYDWEHTPRGKAGRRLLSEDGIKFEMRLDRLSAWRTDPLPDVDNDGTPDNVVFWRAGGCSQDEVIATPRAVVVDEQLGSIDESKTWELFGKPGTTLSPGKPFEYIHTGEENPGSVEVFKYKDKFYIDAWETPHGNNETTTVWDLNVWLRETGRTHRSCGYQWMDKGEN